MVFVKRTLGWFRLLSELLSAAHALTSGHHGLLSSSHLLEGLLGDPGVPMLSKNIVSLLGSEGLTERVLVHADSLGLSLSEESVEERWGDPRLKDLPATNVGADHGAAVRVLGSEGYRGAECSGSEGFHGI